MPEETADASGRRKAISLPRRLSPIEVSERAEVSISTLDRWRIDGFGPPSQRTDGRITYDEAAFEVWLEAYSAQAGRTRLKPGPRRR